jgi:hypothetical protein
MSDKEFNSKILPATVREYITALVKKMRYRRKVREDVRAEITAHFEDELKDCKNDEEKEMKAKQLLSDFGDLKLLAILLRRAKKRCRPLWRTVFARTFQVIGILIVCFIFYTIWFSFGEPTIRVDYVKLLNRMNHPDIRQQDNAWPHYEKAIELYVPQSPIVHQFTSYRSTGKAREDALWLKDLLRDNSRQIQVWIEKNQKYWNNFSPEQKSVILKCFKYDWVPFPKIVHQNYSDWQGTPFNYMTEHIIRSINNDSELMNPHPRGILPSNINPEFPKDELEEWLKQRKIPANFMQAVSVAVLQEALKRFSNLPKDIRGKISDVELEYIGPWVRQNEAAWRQFVTGSAKSYCYRPLVENPNDQDKPLWSILAPPLNTFRDLARLGIWHSRVERAGGKLQQSIDDCLAIARSAVHWQGKGSIIEQLVGMGIGNLGHREIITILTEENLSAPQLQKLQEQLSQIYPKNYPLLSIEGERLAFMDVVQRSFTDGGPGGGHLIPGSWDQYIDTNHTDSDESEKRLLMPLYTALSMAHARRDATIEKANQIYDLQSKLARMTPYKRHISDLKSTEEIIQESGFNYRFFLLGISMPASERTSEIAYRGKMIHDSTLTITAIKRWQLQNNQYPAELDELVKAGLLKELPNDPYSDKPLVYKKTDDDFILYSIGPNFKDDGGEVAMWHGSPRKWGTDKEGDIVLWPIAKSLP